MGNWILVWNPITNEFNFSPAHPIPAAHHTTHEDGGTDSIKLDDLAAPDNNTDLDVSIAKHGLCLKAPNDAAKFLRGDATWAVPPGAGLHHLTHEDGGIDEISVAGLSGLLTDDQNPVDHHLTHENGAADEISIDGLSGLLADAQNPVAHGHVEGDVVGLVADLAAKAPLASPTFTGDVVAPNLNYNEGILSEPTITSVDATHIKVTTCQVLIRSDAVFGADETLYRKTVPEDDNLLVTAGVVNYIYVFWSAGTPVYGATASRSTINHSNYVPVARVSLAGAVIDYQLSYGLVGKGGTARNIDRVLRIRGSEGIEKESGLTITETGVRVVNIGAGVVWFGTRRIDATILTAIAQGGVGVFSDLWYHTGAGTWAKTAATNYNNTQYDLTVAPFGLTDLLANRYAVNWIFRNVTTNEIDIVLGTGDYTQAQATATMIPDLPPQLASFYILCGRIIVKKSVNTAFAIENVANVSLRQSVTQVHSELSNLAYADAGHTGFEPTVTKGNLTATAPVSLDQTRQVIGGAAVVSLVNDAAAAITEIDTGALANSDTVIPTSNAVKTVTDGLVPKALYDAQSILAATLDDTPAALIVAEQTLVGRITGGNIAALSVVQVQTLLSLGTMAYETATGYFKCDCSNAITAFGIHRDVNDSLIQLLGGTTSAFGAIINLFGSTHAVYPGALHFYVSNAAKNAYVLAAHIPSADAPSLNMASHDIVNVHGIQMLENHKIYASSDIGTVDIIGGTGGVGSGSGFRAQGYNSVNTGSFAIYVPNIAHNADLTVIDCSGCVTSPVVSLPYNYLQFGGGGVIRTAINDQFVYMVGGNSTAGKGAFLVCYGADHAQYPGRFDVRVPNAAKTSILEVLRIDGVTDTPHLNLLAHRISGVANPIDAQDAATRAWCLATFVAI